MTNTKKSTNYYILSAEEVEYLEYIHTLDYAQQENLFTECHEILSGIRSVLKIKNMDSLKGDLPIMILNCKKSLDSLVHFINGKFYLSSLKHILNKKDLESYNAKQKEEIKKKVQFGRCFNIIESDC